MTTQASFTPSWNTLLVSLASLLLARVAYSLFFHPLANYPGPLVARLGLFPWAFIRIIKADSASALIRVHKKYGKWVRIGYNELSTCDSDAVNILYTAGSKWTKTPFYTTFKDPSGPHNLFSVTSADEHSNIRRMSASAYTMNSLLQFESEVQRRGVAFCEKMQTPDEKGESVNLGLILQYLASDVVGALAFGGEDGFGMISTLKDEHGFLDAVESVNEAGFVLGSMRHFGPAFWNFIGKVGGPPPAVAKLFETARRGMTMRQERIDKHEINEGEGGDMLSTFAKAKDPVTGKRVTPDEVVRMSLAVLAAGSDTTSTTMRSLVMFLLTSDKTYEKVLAEIDNAFDTNHLSFPPTYAQTVKLEYFQACVKEALRMWPAVAWVMARQAPAEGGRIGDKYFAPGTSVGISAFAYHRQCEFFGPDADVFRPERWLEATPSRKKEMEKHFLSFGAGSRICIGRNISMLEISVIMPMFLRFFSIGMIPRSSVSPHKKSAVRIGQSGKDHTWHVRSLWFAIQSDFWVKLQQRNPIPEHL